MRRHLEAGEAHGFGQPRRFTLDHVAGGLGGHVTRREAGPAGGQHQIERVLIRPVGEQRGDLGAVVGEDRFFGDLPPQPLLNHLADHGAGLILVDALMCPVADREHPYAAHGQSSSSMPSRSRHGWWWLS